MPSPCAILLVPTYNEKENLRNLVERVSTVANIDILIIDDNSPDGTGRLADVLATQFPHVFTLHRGKRAGLGPAYISGFHWALDRHYEHILQMDADLSHPPDLIPKLLELIQTHDMVLGSRWVPGGGTREWSVLRQFISRMGSFYARSILGISIRDATCGFKCIRREVLERIAIDTLESAGYVFQIEMTYRAVKAGFNVYETPIVFRERNLGDSKMSWRIVVEAVLRVPLLRRSKHS